MKCVVWNCRGAGGSSFPTIVKDYMRVYGLDFIAILEPKINGDRATAVIRKTGLFEGTKVEARGFFGGLWHMWKHTCLSMSYYNLFLYSPSS